jgi:Flp pilus assembly protein TadG
MALVMPILLLLVVGIWATARAFNVKNTMDHAVREAARYGATVDPWDSGASPGTVRALIDAELSAAAIPTADVDTVCIVQILEAADGCDVAGTPQVTGAPTDQVVVKIEYPGYQLDFIFFSTTVDLHSSAIARWES